MEDFIHYILHVTGARDVTLQEQIQELWSGYGQIYRLHLSGAEMPSVIVKWIKPPLSSSHPRGWNTSFGNQRKLKSYEVEANWYQNYNPHVCAAHKYPTLLGHLKKGNIRLLILEDLTCSGFTTKTSKLKMNEISSVLKWLALFHARFMEDKCDGLWEIGTYWHLDTRPEELDKMTNLELKKYAQKIDEKLTSCRFQTIVHGDAKQANFAFHKEGKVAAFDFQYVGRGCGIKDVVYFLSSCLSGEEMKEAEDRLLHIYFEELKMGLSDKYTSENIELIEKEWRCLYMYAWADFARFLDGWSPGHYKLNDYVNSQIELVLKA